MSENFKTIVKHLNEDAGLRDRVVNASSNEERKQIMQSAGMPVPTKEEIQNAQALADVAGAGNTMTYVTLTMTVAGAFA
jgi:hypothetical protein